MLDILKVSLVQTELVWGDVKSNLYHFSNLLSRIQKPVNLVILPEMFTSGFLMDNKDKIAPFAQQTISWMQEKATKLNAVVIGSIIVKEDEQYYNRLFVVDQSGVIAKYDKRHLFRMGGEDSHFEQGMEKTVFTIGKWRICPLICYDLRFPVWSRNQDNYDLLIYVANWPNARQEVWNTLLKARAIENQAYVVGVNRIGTDGLDLTYSGGSCAIDSKGKTIENCKDFQSEIRTFELDLRSLQSFRNKFPVAYDADAFQIKK